MKTLKLAIVMALVWTPLPAVLAEAPPSLANNPFSRPPQVVVSSSAGIREQASDSDGDFALLATMVTGETRLANVGGRILRPGQIVHGYRLIRVGEDHAIFEVNGQQLRVLVRPEREEVDEEPKKSR